MNLRIAFCLFISLSFVVCEAQAPFEKKSKWGLIDTISNKVIVKPKYSSITPISSSKIFKVSKAKDDSQTCYGLIDQQGKIIAPIGADSISTFNDYLIWHGNKVTPIDDNRAVTHVFTLIYDFNGQLVFKEDGQIDDIYPGGFIFSSLEVKGRHGIVHDFLYDSELKRITDESMRIWKKNPNYILIKEFDNWSQTKGYSIFSTATFKPIARIKEQRYHEIAPNLLVFSDGKNCGYTNFESGESTLTDFTRCSLWDGSFTNENRIILYNLIKEPALAIGQNGTIESGKIIRDMNYGGLKFVSQNEGGNFNINGLECNDVVPVTDRRDLYSVKIGDKWGVYDSYKNELIIPVNLPAPVMEIFRNEYFRLESDNSLYNSAGENVFNADNNKIADVEDGLVYIDNSWVPQGIYSIPLRKWILPCGKYDNITRMEGGNFAARSKTTIYVISPKGIVLNTLSNASEICNWDGEYFIRVIGTNGKMGIINKNNGQWIVPCVYENDIAWGDGKGQNRRFAISRKTDSGEAVVVMTVGGKKIASQFFPYGSSRAAIRNFGRKYLYQSF